MESYEFYTFPIRLSTVCGIFRLSQQPQVRRHAAGLSLVAAMRVQARILVRADARKMDVFGKHAALEKLRRRDLPEVDRRPTPFVHAEKRADGKRVFEQE